MCGEVDDGLSELAGFVIASGEGVEVACGVVGAPWVNAGIYLLIEIIAGHGVMASGDTAFISCLADSVPRGCHAVGVGIHYRLDAIVMTYTITSGEIGFAIKDCGTAPEHFRNHPDRVLTGSVIDCCIRIVVAGGRVGAPPDGGLHGEGHAARAECNKNGAKR